MGDSLSARDHARLLDMTTHLLAADDPDVLADVVAGEVMTALPGVSVVFKGEWWTAAEGSVPLWSPAPRAATAHELSFIRNGWPFVAHLPRITPDRPATASVIAGAREWRGSETRSVLRGLFGSQDVIALPLSTAVPSARGFLIQSTAEGGTARERAYTDRLHPLLSGLDAHMRLLRRTRGASAQGAPHRLTAREQAVLALLAEALPATAMARRLRISVRTVHKHVENIYRKLGTRDRLETVLRAQAAGLLPTPVRAEDAL